MDGLIVCVASTRLGLDVNHLAQLLDAVEQQIALVGRVSRCVAGRVSR